MSEDESGTTTPQTAKAKRRKGFAAMRPERRRDIASAGGRAVQRRGTGHQWSSEEAAVAGRKGGRARGRRAAEESDAPGGDTGLRP